MTIDGRHGPVCKCARCSGLDIFKAAPGNDLRPHAYTTAELQDFLRRGLACQLAGGRIAAVVDATDLNYWLALAKGGYGRGGPEDSAALRTFLTRRAAALGLSHLIGSWSAPQTGADTGAKAAMVRAAARSHLPAAAAALKQLEMDVREADGTTLAGRLYAEAQKYERKAQQVADLSLAASYRELAKARYQEAGLVR
jgi:hypothetical protein